MPNPVSTIRNLGPASDSGYARAGIHTAEELRALGPDEAYRRYLAAGGLPHFIGYYAMVMGLMGRPWNDAKGAEKAALRQRFDALKSAIPAKTKRRSAMEAALDALGVVEKP